MLGHDHVADDYKTMSMPCLFEYSQETITSARNGEQKQTVGAMRKTVVSTVTLILLSAGYGFGEVQYQVLYNFAGSQGADGKWPLGNLILDRSGNIYGTTAWGGTSTFAGCSGGCGTVFKLSPGLGGSWVETILYSFCTDYRGNVCPDGASPQAGLIFDSVGNLCGTTAYGGTSSGFCDPGLGCGTVFELSPPSSPAGNWTEKVLYSFCANYVNSKCLDGGVPTSQLTLDAHGNLYGTTSSGGDGHLVNSYHAGTVFELSPGQSSWTETVIYSFCSQGQGNFCPDGADPQAGVTFDKFGSLYGTTQSGGGLTFDGAGTVYKLTPGPNGWTEKVLATSTPPFSNGASPLAAVTFDPLGNLYTTFSLFGQNGHGGVVRIGPGGGGVEFSFDGTNGDTPAAGVTIDRVRSALYGTTSGGLTNSGNVFKIVAPAEETVLYNFCSQPNCADGLDPVAGVVLDNSGNLYGTTKQGGTNGFGLVFEVVQSFSAQSVHSKPAVWHTILPSKARR